MHRAWQRFDTSPEQPLSNPAVINGVAGRSRSLPHFGHWLPSTRTAQAGGNATFRACPERDGQVLEAVNSRA